MRSAGEIWFDALKSRNSNGRGTRVLLKWDPVSLLIQSLGNKQVQLTKKPKSVILGTEGTVFGKPKDDALLNLMNININSNDEDKQ